jgi:hypothetical protein
MTDDFECAEVQDRVRDMLNIPGVYIAGDTTTPDVTTVLISRDGKLFSVKIDEELDPARFLQTLTLTGPYSAGTRHMTKRDVIRQAFPTGPQRDAALQMFEQLEQLRSKVARYYVSYLRYSFIEQLADRNPNGGVVGFLEWVATHAANAYQLNMHIDRFMKEAAEPTKQ